MKQEQKKTGACTHAKEKHKRLDKGATCLWARHNSNRGSLIFSGVTSDLSRVARFPSAGQGEQRLLAWDCEYSTSQSVRKNNLWYHRRFRSYLITDQCVILANLIWTSGLTCNTWSHKQPYRGLVHTTPEISENAALFLRLGLPCIKTDKKTRNYIFFLCRGTKA